MAQTRFPLSLIFFVAHVVEWGTFAVRCEAVAPEGTVDGLRFKHERLES